MDISIKSEEYKILNAMSESTAEESVECDITLPEYMPEILRIVKVFVQPKISSCRAVGDRATVDGICELRMIYTAEDGGLYSYSHTRPFSKYCENECFVDAVDIVARANVSYVNSRALSTRRAELKVGIIFKITSYSVEAERLMNASDSTGFEKKVSHINAVSLGCRKTGCFSMSDTVVPDSPASFVISSFASAVCNDIKKINNKIMLRGEAVVNICYVRADDRTSTCTLKHIIPINQIMEFEGMDERFLGNVFLKVSSVDIISKGESSGEITGFDISLGVEATVNMWESRELSLVTDAYGVGKHLELVRAANKYFVPVTQISDTVIAESSFPLSGECVSKVSDATCEPISVSFRRGKGKVLIEGSINLSVIMRDENGNYNNVIKTMDYHLEKETADEFERLVCEPEVCPVSLDCIASSSSLDVRAELMVSGMVFEEKIIDTVTDITESEIPFTEKRNAITVYFPECENESLWSIARKYNTSVKAVAEENSLDGDTTENLKIVFIPSV